MSDALRLDFTVAGGPFEVSIAWQTEQRFVGLFGPSGACLLYTSDAADE